MKVLTGEKNKKPLVQCPINLFPNILHKKIRGNLLMRGNISSMTFNLHDLGLDHLFAHSSVTFNLHDLGLDHLFAHSSMTFNLHDLLFVNKGHAEMGK
jgi:hypothetical protein